MEMRIGLPQDAETKPRTIESGTWTYRYGYIRSRDCRSSGESGQDYVAFADQEGSLAFVVCDGIGMSYYGDIASRFAGEKLLDWLSGEDALHDDPAAVRDSLDRTLRVAAIECQQEIEKHVYSATLPDMLKEVLDAKKRLGSGTVFACGRLDPPGVRFPRGRLLLTWVGDVRIRVWDKTGEVKLADPGAFDTRHQWNSRVGVVGGGPWIHVDDRLSSGGRHGELLVYTDGLAALDAFGTIGMPILDHVLDREAQHPSSDDMSFMHVRWTINLERGAGAL